MHLMTSNTRPWRAGGFDLLWTQFKGMEEKESSRKKKFLAGKKNELNSTECKKGNAHGRTNFYLKESELNSTEWNKGNAHGRTSFQLRKPMNLIQQKGRKEMLTDDQASSSKKAMNSIQQNGRKEMLTDEQASGWKKAMNSIQQNARKEMVTDKQASNWR